MKVVVTGSHGFLGQHVLETLASRRDVTVDVLGHTNASDARTALTGADCIVHLAGVNRDTEKNIEKGNVGYTRKLLTWTHRYAPYAKIIFASSSQVYLPDSLYGESKREAEILIQAYSKRHTAPSLILRFSNIYGPFCRPFYNSMIATFIHLIMKNEELVVNGTGRQQRDFLYVADAADAIAGAMFYNPKKISETYDICSGALVSVRQVVDLLTKCSPVPVHYRFGPVTEADHPGVAKTFAEAKRGFGWVPKVGLREGLTAIFRQEYAGTHKKAKQKI